MTDTDRRTELTALRRSDEGGCNFCDARAPVWVVRSPQRTLVVRLCDDCIAALKRATK